MPSCPSLNAHFHIHAPTIQLTQAADRQVVGLRALLETAARDHDGRAEAARKVRGYMHHMTHVYRVRTSVARTLVVRTLVVRTSVA
jgi:hypothetical protein